MSTSAVSVRSPARTSSSLAWLVTPAAGTAPVATRPAASPATVASRTAGNTLLVPVDRASIGTSPAADAATRAVPSPPRQMITRAPAFTMRRTAATVSCAVCRIGWPSRNSTSGHRASGVAVPAERPVHRRGDAAEVGAEQRAVHADGAERGEHALDHVGLLGRREHRGLGDQAADVATGERVGHHADDRVAQGTHLLAPLCANAG